MSNSTIHFADPYSICGVANQYDQKSYRGCGLSLLLNRQIHPVAIGFIIACCGIGVGFTLQPSLVALQAHCTVAKRAVVISDRNFFRCLGGACGLAIAAALLQATLKSNLPENYKYLAHSSYSLPAKPSISAEDWDSILNAYAKASHAVFVLQVPFIGVGFLGCIFLRDRGLERPKDPDEEANNAEPVTQGNNAESHGDSQTESQAETPTESQTESKTATFNASGDDSNEKV